MPTMTVMELLVDLYAPLRGLNDRSIVLYRGTIDRLREFLEREPVVDDLTDLVVAKFLAARLRSKNRGRAISPATVRKDQAHLNCLATFAVKRGITKSWLLVAPVKVAQKIPSAYTIDDITAIVLRARKRRGTVGSVPAKWFWPTLVKLCFFTGERISSVLALTWADIDLGKGTVLFPGERRKGKSRDILRPIPPDLVDELRAHAGEPLGRVFPWDRLHLSIYNSLRALVRQAGVVPRGFHGLRKSAASYVAAGGGDASVFLAHENPRLARKYYIDPRIAGIPSSLHLLPSVDPPPPAPESPEVLPFARRPA